MRRRLFNIAAAVSLALFAAAAACWVIGAVRATVWAWRAGPQRTYFLRLEPQHLVVSKQWMTPQTMPESYATDCGAFREYRLIGPNLPQGEVGMELNARYWAVRPPGAGFRSVSSGVGDFLWKDESGATRVHVRNYFGTVEVPWWSLLLALALLPAWWAVARLRVRARERRGLCAACGYDLRASPDRCPECGAPAGAVVQ